MPSWLCKIWRFIANIVGKIVDIILDIVKKIVGFVVDAIDAIGDSLFGGNLGLWLLLGLGAYFLLTKGKSDDEDTGEDASYYLSPPENRPV